MRGSLVLVIAKTMRWRRRFNESLEQYTRQAKKAWSLGAAWVTQGCTRSTGPAAIESETGNGAGWVIDNSLKEEEKPTMSLPLHQSFVWHNPIMHYGHLASLLNSCNKVTRLSSLTYSWRPLIFRTHLAMGVAFSFLLPGHSTHVIMVRILPKWGIRKIVRNHIPEVLKLLWNRQNLSAMCRFRPYVVINSMVDKG